MSDNDTLITGMSMAFMILLSAQPDLSFQITRTMIKSFPFDEYEIQADVDQELGVTTFVLVCNKDRCH